MNGFQTLVNTVTGWFNPAGDSLLPANITARMDQLNADLIAERAKGVNADQAKINRILSELQSLGAQLRNVSGANLAIVSGVETAAKNVRSVFGFGLGTLAFVVVIGVATYGYAKGKN